MAACEVCNNSFSLDEQYLACFITAVCCGTTDPLGVDRDKVRRLLSENPKLAERIARIRAEDRAGKLLWMLEEERVRKIVLKLARGHAACGTSADCRSTVGWTFLGSSGARGPACAIVEES